MALFLVVTALSIALLALTGWPGNWDLWMRALLALAALSTALAGLSWQAFASSASTFFQPARRPHLLDRMVGFTSLALGLALLYLILGSGPTALYQASDVLIRIGYRGGQDQGDEEKEGENANAAQGPAVARAEISTGFDPEGTSIPSSAHLEPSDTPEVSLRLPSRKEAKRLHESGVNYLTSYAHHAFDGNRWTSPDSSEFRTLTRNRRGLIQVGERNELPGSFRYTVLHRHLIEEENTVKTLQGAHFVRLPELTRMGPSTLLHPADQLGPSYYEYEASSSPREFRALLAAGQSIRPGMSDPAYLAPTVHPGLRRQLQRQTAGISRNLPVADQLAALQNWLRQTRTYSLVVMDPENGKSVLENFLGDEGPTPGTGFCIHFASAAVLMARELGVPSRICFGWRGGHYYPPHKQFVFRNNHAHSWAELYLADHGWVIFDTTPTLALPPSVLARPGETPPSLTEFLDPYSEEDLLLGNRFFGPWDWKRIGLFSGIILLILLGLLGVKLRTLPGHLSPTSPLGALPIPDYLKLFQGVCAQFGRPMPAGRTLQQHLGVLREEGLTLPFGDDLLSYHYKVTYRNHPRDNSSEKNLSSQIKSWTPEFPSSPELREADRDLDGTS